MGDAMSANPRANGSRPANPVILKNAVAAPVLFFDGAPVFGVLNGIVEIELAARYLLPQVDGNVSTDIACVAHLRCSLAGAESLVDALDKALDMARNIARTAQAQDDEQRALRQ
jgi:hypothetical protein